MKISYEAIYKRNMKRFLRAKLLKGLGGTILFGGGALLLLHYNLFFLSKVSAVIAAFIFMYEVAASGFNTDIYRFWKWDAIAKRHYKSVKAKAKTVREAFQQSQVVGLGLPTEKYEFDRIRQSYIDDYDYLSFLMPWSRDLAAYYNAIEEHLDKEELAYLSEEFVSEEEFNYSKNLRHGILVYEEKELIALDGNVYAFSDIVSYRIWDNYSSHVVHETVTRVDTETQNKRMAAGYLLGGMKGVCLAQMSPATTTVTSSRTVYGGACYLAITVKEATMQEKVYDYILDYCKGGEKQKRALLNFLRTCCERNIHKL